MTRYLACAALICLSTQAHAQSALETAAFILLGPVAKPENGGAAYVYSDDMALGNGATMAVKHSLIRIDDCKYQIKTDATVISGQKREPVNSIVSINLSSVSDVTGLQKDGTVILMGAPDVFCATGSWKGGTMNECAPHVAGRPTGDLARWRKAYDYFRANYCKGRAF